MADHLLPVDVSDVELAFPANGLDYMPAMEDIPNEFRHGNVMKREWIEFQRCWFYDGLSDRFSFVPAEGIDPNQAWRLLTVIQTTRASKHQHKEACVAYLASLWMDAVLYGPAGCTDEELRTIGGFPKDEYLAANPR